MKKYNVNPYQANTIFNTSFLVLNLSSVAKDIVLYCAYQSKQEMYDLSLNTLSSKLNKSNPTLIKGLNELKELDLIAKSYTKSHYFIHPDLL